MAITSEAVLIILRIIYHNPPGTYARGDGAPPWFFWAPAGRNSCEGIRSPHRSHEICAETHQKSTSGQSRASDHLGLPRTRTHKKTGPLWASGAPLNIRGSSEYQDPSEHQAPLSIRPPLSIRSPSEPSGTLWAGPKNTDILFIFSYS